MSDVVALRTGALVATVSTRGAELQSVADRDGRDWLWDGDPRWWTGRAPILFPTVGVTADGARFGDRHTRLGKHGFARDSEFALVTSDDAHATFRLEASEATRAVYPFDFRLDVTHRLDEATLTIEAVVSNRGGEPMPAGFGFHPALRWPLPGTGARSRFEHLVRFDADEPGALREITPDGLFSPTPRPTPVHDNELHLRDTLFEQDALVWDRPASRGLFYGVADRPGVRVDFPYMPMLGIWTKPGAGYLCIEPWHSHADEEGFAGQFAEKAGIVTLAPGETKTYAMSLTFGVPII